MSLIDTTRDLVQFSEGSSEPCERFCRTRRESIRALVSDQPRLAELAQTFPALLFALATQYGTVEARRAAIDLVQSGAPLRHAAERLGLPWWLRRLPPEAFRSPLSDPPDGAVFALRITNLVPTEAGEAAEWLERTLFAHAVAGESYALWIARQKRFPAGAVGEITQSLLAAWAWHGLSPSTPAHALLRTGWSEAISLRRALEEAKAWSLRIDLAVALGAGIEDPWFPAGASGAFQFIPLTRLEQFLSEAETMSNCLDQFADNIRRGRSRVFSVRKSGRVVADLELAPHDDDCGIPRIVQLRGPRNRRVGADVWQATMTWLAAQDFRPLPRVDEPAERQRRQQLIRAIWRPMLDHVKGTVAETSIQALAFGKEVSRSFRAFQAAFSAPEPAAIEPAAAPGRPRRRRAAQPSGQ